jgi:hypothetical protein
MPENSKKDCACGGKKRIKCELEDEYMHVREVGTSKKRRGPAYIVRKGGIIFGRGYQLAEVLMTHWNSERRPIPETC